jgi:hypothetical protein
MESLYSFCYNCHTKLIFVIYRVGCYKYPKAFSLYMQGLDLMSSAWPEWLVKGKSL